MAPVVGTLSDNPTSFAVPFLLQVMFFMVKYEHSSKNDGGRLQQKGTDTVFLAWKHGWYQRQQEPHISIAIPEATNQNEALGPIHTDLLVMTA